MEHNVMFQVIFILASNECTSVKLAWQQTYWVFVGFFFALALSYMYKVCFKDNG